MKHIPLTKGQKAIVDDEDYNWLNRFSWACQQSKIWYYAFRGYRIRGKPGVIRLSMAKEILEYHKLADKNRKYFVRHVNGDTLDLRKGNMYPQYVSQDYLTLKNK